MTISSEAAPKPISFTKGLVSTIVLNWNNKDVIFACIDSLLSQSCSAYEIILVDNGSTDGSLELLEKRYAGKVTFVRNPKNLGFSEGVNSGIRQARGEFIALLNSDAEAEPHWLETMVLAAQQSDSIGMCACKIYLAGRSGILDNTGEELFRDGLNRARGRLEKDCGQFDAEKDTLCPSGCAALYRRKMLDEAGGFDKYFFAYGEDLDIGLRGRMLGYRCVYVPEAVVHHKLSSSTGLVSPLKAYYVERNRLWILLKCYPLSHLLASPYYTFLRYFYILYGMITRKGPASDFANRYSVFHLAWIILKVYFSTVCFFPYLMKQRSLLKKKSKWTTREFEEYLKKYGISARDAALRELA